MEEVQPDVPLVDKIVGYFMGMAIINQCIDETTAREIAKTHAPNPTLATKLSDHISETIKQYTSNFTTTTTTNNNNNNNNNNTTNNNLTSQ
jgi:hypothetical protein